MTTPGCISVRPVPITTDSTSAGPTSCTPKGRKTKSMTSTNDLEGFTSDVVVTPPGGLTSDVVVTPPRGGLTTEGSGGITSLEAVTALNGLFGSEGRQDEGA